jgi:hypothetical protein
MMTRSMAFKSARSVPGLTGSQRSAVRASGVSRGSTTIRLAPRSRACQIHCITIGKHSATLEPTTRMLSASGMSVIGSGARSMPKALL